ncbi:MAG: cyclic nucleotide-gated ion channel [Methyloligellaceae bacterium]
MARSWRRRVHDILEDGDVRDPASVLVNGLLIILIIANVIAFALETVPHLEARYGDFFHLFNLFSVAVFSLEYFLRLWSCVEIPVLKQLPPARARLHFAARPLLIIDLFAVLPFYVGFLFGLHDMLFLRVLRLFRFLKLAHYSPALHSIGRVMVSERNALLGAFLVMMVLLLFASAGIYYLEREVQPEAFGSIPAAAWWALATLTTVGYGDVTPVTPFGKLFGGLIMIFGLGMFALPVAIVATGFAEESRRREFVVTWGTVARVPLFADLSASTLAAIMGQLSSRTYPEGARILQVGQPAEALFFITSGEVIVHTDDGPVKLGEGDFFGELSLIYNRPHRHTVVAASRVRLLVLEKPDFDRLAEQEPELMAHIRKVAEERQAAAGQG